MVLAVIQARLGSTRFPNKALADLCGRPLIAHVVDRVRKVRGVDDVVLAVPARDAMTFANLHMGISVQAPDVPEDDVLARFVAVAARFRDHDTILRATGDSPLFNPARAEEVLALYRASGCEYACNVDDDWTPDVEVFGRAALLQAQWHVPHDDRDSRQHVTPYIRQHYGVAALPPPNWSMRKMSVDSIEDLERVRLQLESAA